LQLGTYVQSLALCNKMLTPTVLLHLRSVNRCSSQKSSST
jgi:hypothetical protein